MKRTESKHFVRSVLLAATLNAFTSSAFAEQPAVEQPAVEQPTDDPTVAEQGSPSEKRVESSPIVELSVYPPQIELRHADDLQRIVAVAERADGVTLDVTDEVRWEMTADGPNEVAVVEQGVVRPQGNGRAMLNAALDDHTSAAEAAVVGFEQTSSVSFRHDVIPVFMRAGCNSGGCHGSSRGKDGFRLSLFGFDPAGDHFRLTRELATRRLDLALPDESLLLQKSVGSAPHTGGKRFEVDTAYYRSIRDWIAEGARNDVDEAPAVTALAIYPPRAVLQGEGATQQFIAVAEYSDGRRRDVTDLVLFQSNNDGSAAIDDSGLVTAGQRGEA
ncbi:MAG: hypothetical protein AAF961_14870, partial [Planctomycetota bacterium]